MKVLAFEIQDAPPGRFNINQIPPGQAFYFDDNASHAHGFYMVVSTVDYAAPSDGYTFVLRLATGEVNQWNNQDTGHLVMLVAKQQ